MKDRGEKQKGREKESKRERGREEEGTERKIDRERRREFFFSSETIFIIFFDKRRVKSRVGQFIFHYLKEKFFFCC
jgi:hypothetical protein